HEDLPFLALIFARDDAYGIVDLDVHSIASLQYLGSEGDDPHVVLLSQLSCNGPEDTRALGLLLAVDDDGSVVVEADVGAVLTADALRAPDDDRLHDVALLDGAAGGRSFDGRHDDVTDIAASAEGAAQNADAHQLLCARVVRRFQPGLRLYHSLFSFSLLRLLDDLGNSPILVFAELSRLDDADLVADAALVLFVVRFETAGPRDLLLVDEVDALVRHGGDDRLIHLVG